MEEVDRARALNALLALPRLERMLRVYRTWVNMEGVEGGMALSRRELQKSLSTRNISSPRVDLVTLLTTAALLAQGALADKARFVFSLVDLDTEDDIVEAELALVISTCCNGLLRLGLIKEEEEMTEMDAMAVAYEAFDFVELEDGDKMTLAMFLKWFVFHPRPKELLERVSCLFSVCDAVRKMKEALEERRRSLNVELFRRYNDVHFGSLDEQAEGVGVLAGPMAGKVSAAEAGVLEVGTFAKH
uniref:EF-hand domain-containing protein n=1 Tax=Phytophthora ramorum TaxID=164328 RepID=H3HB16_PHYRM